MKHFLTLATVFVLMAGITGARAQDGEGYVEVMKTSIKHGSVYGYEGQSLKMILLFTRDIPVFTGNADNGEGCYAIVYGKSDGEKFYITPWGASGWADGTRVEAYLHCWRRSWYRDGLEDVHFEYMFRAYEDFIDLIEDNGGLSFSEYQRGEFTMRNFTNAKGVGVIEDWLGGDIIRKIPAIENIEVGDKIGATYGNISGKRWGKFSGEFTDYKSAVYAITDWLESKGYQDLDELLNDDE